MFNAINLEDVMALGTEINTVAYPTVTAEQLQELYITEALGAMARRDLADEAKDQAVFNKQLASEFAGAPEKAPARFVDLLKTCIGKVQVANAQGDNGAFLASQTGLEMLLSFFNQVAGAVARSSFYVYESAVKAEDRAIDLVRDGNSGFGYAGPRIAVVLPETAREACDSIIEFMNTLYKAGIGGTSQWFKANFGMLQIGGRRNDDGSYETFLTVDELWNDTRAYRTQRAAAQAAARSNAFASMVSMLHGLEAAERHGNISDAAEPVVVVKKSRAKAKVAE